MDWRSYRFSSVETEREERMMGKLTEAKALADQAFEAFCAQCKASGFADQWEAYKADVAGEVWPVALNSAHRDYLTKLHAFYALRDGPHGWLGGRERASAAQQRG